MELEREKLRLGHGQTVQELQSMIAILEREAQNHRGTVSKRQALMNELEAARLRARSAIAKFEVGHQVTLHDTSPTLNLDQPLTALAWIQMHREKKLDNDTSSSSAPLNHL